VGKSILAAYVAWMALREGRACGVVKVARGVRTEAVLRALAEEAGAELIALYDPSPTEVYYDPDYVKLTETRQVDETLKELGALTAVERRAKILAVFPSGLYNAVLEKAEEPALKLLEKRLEVDLRIAEEFSAYSRRLVGVFPPPVFTLALGGDSASTRLSYWEREFIKTIKPHMIHFYIVF
jgi:hypothetical protein